MRQKIAYLLCVLAMMISMSSCDSIMKDKKDTGSSAEIVDSVPNYVAELINKQDSAISALARQDSTFIEELNAVKSGTATLEAKIGAQTEKPGAVWKWVTVISGILALLAIFYSFIGQSLDKDEQKKKERNNEKHLNTELQKIWNVIDKLKSQPQDLKRTNSYAPAPNLSSEIDELKRRIRVLEDKARENDEAKSLNPKIPEFHETSNAVRTIYAKSNSSKYFTEILTSNQDGCIYKITLRKEDEGEFEIISLQKMRQTNGWKDIVETTGNCLIEEAKDFKVREPGICTKIDNSTWEVKKPLKIEIR